MAAPAGGDDDDAAMEIIVGGDDDDQVIGIPSDNLNPGRIPAIIVGMHNSQRSLSALEWTIDNYFVPLEINLPHRLVVVNVLPPIEYPMSRHLYGVDVDVARARARNFVRNNVYTVWRTKMSYRRDELPEIETIENAKDVGAALCDAVPRIGGSMLVVGRCGRGFIKRLFKGSVTNYCLRRCPCPVMVPNRPSLRRLLATPR